MYADSFTPSEPRCRLAIYAADPLAKDPESADILRFLCNSDDTIAETGAGDKCEFELVPLADDDEEEGASFL